MTGLAVANQPVAVRTATAPNVGAAFVPANALLGEPRMAFLDALKVVLITMVIVHHAAQPYAPSAGVWPVKDTVHSPILGPFLSVNASFGMPLLFLVSGYFVPGSFDRRGARGFIRERFVRLGLPLVTFSALLFVPLIRIAYGRLTPPRESFLPFLGRTLFVDWHLGHLWFIADLLAYVLVYAAWRTIAAAGGPARPKRAACPLRHGAIVAFTLSLAAVAFVIRVRYPIDRWTAVLGVLPMEPAHF